MAFEGWTSDDLKHGESWLRTQKAKLKRLETAYAEIKELKDLYKEKVVNPRKDIFKDRWFHSSYAWTGANYSSFKALGQDDGEVQKEVEAYYKAKTKSLDDALDSLLDAEKEIKDAIRNRFGNFFSIDDLISSVVTAIKKLTN